MEYTIAGFTKILRTTKAFERVLNKVNIVSLGNGKCTADLKIEEEHTNLLGGLHGGLSATLVDTISTFALHTHKHRSVPHVSVNINMEYLKGAVVGDEIQIIADTVKCGKSLAFSKVSIKDKKTGTILVKGTHTQFFLHPQA